MDLVCTPLLLLVAPSYTPVTTCACLVTDWNGALTVCTWAATAALGCIAGCYRAQSCSRWAPIDGPRTRLKSCAVPATVRESRP